MLSEIRRGVKVKFKWKIWDLQNVIWGRTFSVTEIFWTWNVFKLPLQSWFFDRVGVQERLTPRVRVSNCLACTKREKRSQKAIFFAPFLFLFFYSLPFSFICVLGGRKWSLESDPPSPFHHSHLENPSSPKARGNENSEISGFEAFQGRLKKILSHPIWWL